MSTLKLGVNLDHVATVRQARYRKNDFNSEPDLISISKLAILGGADSITLHLREDRRHIQDDDVIEVKESTAKPLNLEMANVSEMVNIATKILPDYVCLVPEKRQELTTEGGLNVAENINSLKETTHILQDHGIEVSLFVDPDIDQIDFAKSCNANSIELHTGKFANSETEIEINNELERLRMASVHANQLDLKVNAGHGINSLNVPYILMLPNLHELNVGHHLISNSIIYGIEKSIRDFKSLISGYCL